jgi:hypothetical protein
MLSKIVNLHKMYAINRPLRGPTGVRRKQRSKKQNCELNAGNLFSVEGCKRAWPAASLAAWDTTSCLNTKIFRSVADGRKPAANQIVPTRSRFEKREPHTYVRRFCADCSGIAPKLVVGGLHDQYGPLMARRAHPPLIESE